MKRTTLSHHTSNECTTSHRFSNIWKSWNALSRQAVQKHGNIPWRLGHGPTPCARISPLRLCTKILDQTRQYLGKPFYTKHEDTSKTSKCSWHTNEGIAYRGFQLGRNLVSPPPPPRMQLITASSPTAREKGLLAISIPSNFHTLDVIQVHLANLHKDSMEIQYWTTEYRTCNLLARYKLPRTDRHRKLPSVPLSSLSLDRKQLLQWAKLTPVRIDESYIEVLKFKVYSHTYSVECLKSTKCRWRPRVDLIEWSFKRKRQNWVLWPSFDSSRNGNPK